MQKSLLRKPAPTSVNVTAGKRGREYLTEREVERLIEAAKQNRCGHRDATAILVSYRHGLRASGDRCVALGRHRPRHRALACAQGQGRGCQCASDIGPRKSGIAQAPARSTNIALRLRLGTSRTAFRSRISAHGGQGGRRREIHVSRSFPHAAPRLRVQARQRRPRHARHPGLSRPPLDHVYQIDSRISGKTNLLPLHSAGQANEAARSARRRQSFNDGRVAIRACFIVRDHGGQALAYVYFEEEPGRRAAAHL